MNSCSKINLCIAVCFRNTFSFLVCVQTQFLPPCFLAQEDEPFPVPSCRQPAGCPPWQQPPPQPGSPEALRNTREAKPSLRCPISPLNRDGLGLLSAKWAKLDGTSGSGCPCAQRETEDSRDGAKRGHLRGVDLLLLLGFSGMLEAEVQLLTWLQVGVNMLQLLLLTALDFCTVQAFFCAFCSFLPIEWRSHCFPVPWSFWGDWLNNAHKKGFESTRREVKEDKML